MLDELRAHLVSMGDVAVAVSGGIDSLTLATAAMQVLGDRATMHHATSPAVPAEATERTRLLADRLGWQLDIFDAGEFNDPTYRANPVNRCFFCKTSLYGSIARRTSSQILSGTNLDDLGEYRPGLDAAREHHVRHPFVEVGIDKATVRQFARHLGLGALSDLPAAPCLSSRIETGLRIEPPVLAMVHDAELLVTKRLAPRTVRCRVRAGRIVVELDRETLGDLDPPVEEGLRADIADLGLTAGLTMPVQFAIYRNGSAFLRNGQ